MRFQSVTLLAVVLAAQAAAGAPPPGTTAPSSPKEPLLKIPPVKTALNLDGQPLEVKAWGEVAAVPDGPFRLSVTVDLGDLQQHLTPILAAQLNTSERCGERLTIQRAEIAPAAPASALLTAWVHYERYACVKAFHKEVNKRLVAGDGVIGVNLTPRVGDDGIGLDPQVQRVEADGTLGELLRAGELGQVIRKKIAKSIEGAIRKSASLNRPLPEGLAEVASIEGVRFADGGEGRLWLNIAGQVHISEDQFRGLLKSLPH